MDEYRTKRRKSLNLTMESEKNIDQLTKKNPIQHKWITKKKEFRGETELFVIFSNISLRA